MTLINLRERYDVEKKNLQDKLAIENVHQLPKISKVTVTAGIGKYRHDKDLVAYVTSALERITGQKPAVTTAKKAIAGFKVRSGEPVGLKVTLRGQKMDDFLNRLINISLPRIRDFRGLDEQMFDKFGNLTLGFRDQAAFVELGAEAFDKPFGLAVTLTINHSDPKKSYTLLTQLGFPIKLG